MNDKIIYMDDLPFNLNEQETERLMQKIPVHIAATGREWGFNDTVFRDNLFVYIVKEILHFPTTDDYYKSDVFKSYSEKGELLPNSMLIGEVKRFKVSFNMVYYDKDLNEAPQHHGDFECIAIDEKEAKINSFFELAKQIFHAGYRIKKLEINSIEEMK